jgi:hypothetical protein
MFLLNPIAFTGNERALLIESLQDHQANVRIYVSEQTKTDYPALYKRSTDDMQAIDLLTEKLALLE